MNNAAEPGTPPMLELSVPEFFMNRIGKAESVGNGCIKFTCCSLNGGILVPQFAVILPIADVSVCAREAMQLAAEIFNAHMFKDERLLC